MIKMAGIRNILLSCIGKVTNLMQILKKKSLKKKKKNTNYFLILSLILNNKNGFVYCCTAHTRQLTLVK